MGLLDFACDAVSGAADFVSDAASDAVDIGSTVVDGAVEVATDTASDIYSAGSGVVEVASDVGNAASESVADAASWVGEAATGAVDVASSGADSLGTTFGGIPQGVSDVLETGWNVASPFVGKVPIPGVGEALSAVQAGYHSGAGIYDAVTGNRDGAVIHAAQLGANVLGMIPGVSEVAGTIDMGLGQTGAFGKATGVDAPQSIGDILAEGAVFEVNRLFGEDKDKGSGTRRGEIGAGILALAPGGPISTVIDAFTGFENSNKIGDAVGDVFETPHGAKPLGASKPTYGQRAGRFMHDHPFPVLADLDD